MGDNNKPSYWHSLKAVLMPLAVMFGIASTVFVFAAEAWVKGIVQDEHAAADTTVAAHTHTLGQHTVILEQHDEDIQENQDEIDKVDDKFIDFIREILERM